VVLMSARPGKIQEIVPVPLARPRSADVDRVAQSEEFVAITTHLWTRLRDMQVDGQRRAAAPQAVAS
jgi:ABC-type nitrate/sulfonate/bicarbonate transport system ATPase subunit